MRKTVVVLGLFLALSLYGASAPELVRDFRKTVDPVGSYPEHFFSNGERGFFFADDGSGKELWTSDGTAAGTRLLANLTPGPGPYDLDVDPRFVASGDLVYFWYHDRRAFDSQLWRSDGTPAGTFPVVTGAYYQGAVAPIGERGAIVSSNELFVTDGETAQSLGGEFSAEALVSLEGIVYGVSGDMLWRTAGTAAGTREVFDFETGIDGSQLVAHDGALYLLGENETGELAEVWRSDGTAAGTARIATFEPVNEWPRLLASEAGAFVIVDRGDTTQVHRLNTAGAVLAFTLPAGYDGDFAAASRDFLVIETDEPDGLWLSDGTQQGTRQIAGGEAYNFAVTSSHVLYQEDSKVWAHDGTAARLLTEHRPWSGLEVAEAGGRMLFAVEDQEHGTELWVTDGRGEGTALLKNIRPDTDSEGSLARRVGDFVVFRARSDEHGLEPWVIDGAGLRVVDIDVGPDSSNPHLFTTLDGRLLFLSDPELNHPDQIRVLEKDGLRTIMSYDFTAWWPNEWASYPVIDDRAFVFGFASGIGEEVWTTGGMVENTRRGTGLEYVDDDFDPVAANGVVFFVGDYDSLWRTDGTEAGTYAIASNVQQLHATPSKLFFVADSSAFGAELWVSDGTLAGTHVVKDIHKGQDSSLDDPYDDFEIVFQALGDKIVFAADDGVHGLEPWVSDGTEAGTMLLRDVAPGDEWSMLPAFDREVSASAGGFAYFVADDGVHGHELWRTDGTPEGTVLVHDIARGRASSTPARMRAIGDRVYFAANDGVHGRELWWSSLAGTGLVADVAPGTDSSLPHDMTELDGWLYFFAQTEATGDELWRVEVPRVKRRAAR
ncbi:MAG TPA: ELWxxDGT repeat protein [Thermoanaerobaculia bacterium]